MGEFVFLWRSIPKTLGVFLSLQQLSQLPLRHAPQKQIIAEGEPSPGAETSLDQGDGQSSAPGQDDEL